MSAGGWRLRMLVRRAMPHTPAKRWLYGASVGLAAFTLIAVNVWGGLGFFILIGLVRWGDVRRSGARRAPMPTARAYFFEGEDG